MLTGTRMLSNKKEMAGIIPARSMIFWLVASLLINKALVSSNAIDQIFPITWLLMPKKDITAVKSCCIAVDPSSNENGCAAS